jgi:hypothetical protein
MKRTSGKEWRTINTALDPDVSMFVASSTITGVEETRVWLGKRLKI